MTSLSIKDFDAAMTADVTKNGALAKLVKAWESKNGRRAVAGAGLGLMAVSLAACGGTDSSTTPTDITTDNAAAVSAALLSAAVNAGVVGADGMSDAALIAALASSNDVEAVRASAHAAAVDLGIAVTDAMTTAQLITAIVASNDPAVVDAAVAGLGIAGVDTLAELFAAYNILATPPLTIGIDNYAGTDAANTINGNAAASLVGSVLTETDTFSGLDVINGGGGTDTINISKVGAILLPTNVTVTSVEIANIQSASTVTADTSGWVGLLDLEVDAVGGATVTAASTTAVDVSSSGAVIVDGGAAVTVTGSFTLQVPNSVSVGVTTGAAGNVTIAAFTGDVDVGAAAVNGAGGTVNVLTNGQGASDVEIYGGTNVNVSANDVITGGNITVGSTAVNASGNVVVGSTSGYAAATSASFAMGTIGVTGGDAVTVNVNAYTAAAGVAALTTANFTVTQSAVTVTGDAETTAVTVNQSASAVAVDGSTHVLPLVNPNAGLGVIGVVGGIVTITDATGAALDTADTITTVTLTNAGVTIINSSALSVLNLSSTGTAANTVTINGQSTTTETELDLNLSGLFGLITATTAGLADTDYATVNVNVSAGSIVGGLSVTDATAVNISGGGSASLGTVTTAAAAVITSTNTGGISLSVGVVDAAFVGTNSSGNDTVTMFAASTADHTTGNGDDTVIMTAGFVGAGGSVDAGGGDDTISVTVAAAVTAGIEDQISNFEVLSITATSAALAGSVNLANWDDINYVTSAGTGAFALGVSGFTSGGTFELTGGLDVAGAATLTGAFTGLTDEFTVALTSAGALANAGAVFLGGIETLNIELTDTDGFTVAHSSTLNVTDASTTTVNISGDTGLTLTGLTALTTLDASGVTAGGVIFTAVNAASLTGGDGNDQLTGSALADIIDGGDGDDALVGAAGADDISGGDGVDVITGGLGADDMTGGAGADVFEFSTDGSVAGTSLDVISDFNVGGADRIGFGAAGLLLLVEANGTAAGTDVDTTAGGLITFAAADDTLAEKITAIQADTQLDAVNSVAFFEDGGSTYLYYAGAALGNTDDQLIELDGVTGLTAITILNSDVTIA